MLNYFKKNLFNAFFIAILSMNLSACKSANSNNVSDIATPIDQLYGKGLKYLNDKSYQKAAKEFERIFYEHPGNPITAQAELMQAYSLYLAKDYDIANDILELFIKLHPRHPDIAYAYYLKALSNYAQISSVNLDQSRTKIAKEDFGELLRKFPNTKYANDAELKLDLINDHLAGKEMLIGRYYLKNNNPIAALQRFQNVIETYSFTEHAEEALFRMVESNISLGLIGEAKKYAAVLGHNYPKGNWYKKAYRLANRK